MRYPEFQLEDELYPEFQLEDELFREEGEQVLWTLSWGFSIGAGRKRNRLILHLVARVC